MFDVMKDRGGINILWRVAARVDSRIEPIPCGSRQGREDDSSAVTTTFFLGIIPKGFWQQQSPFNKSVAHSGNTASVTICARRSAVSAPPISRLECQVITNLGHFLPLSRHALNNYVVTQFAIASLLRPTADLTMVNFRGHS